jgi:hypothetical protein
MLRKPARNGFTATLAAFALLRPIRRQKPSGRPYSQIGLSLEWSC